MGWGRKAPHFFPMWLKALGVIGTAITLQSAASYAQENTGPLTDRSTGESNVNQVPESRENPRSIDAQLLPTNNVGGISVVSKALAQLKAAGYSPKDHSEKNHLRYTILIIEMPFTMAETLTENWKIMGAVSNVEQPSGSEKLPSPEVVTASHASNNTRFEFRISDALNDEQIGKLVSVGKPVSSPKLLGENGEEVSMRVGREVPYVASFQPLKDENGKDTETLQPKVETLHSGIRLNLTGTLDDDKTNVLLRVNFAQSELKRLETFTFESEHGPLTVQQPTVSATSIDTTCRAPVNKTIALCSGPIVRDVVAEREAPLIKWVPYVGRLFKNTSKATESISSIVLIRCQEHQDTAVDSNVSTPKT